MLYLTAQSKVMVAIEPVDFRKHIDGLAAICRNDFNQQPNNGALYVFRNRSRTMVKVLHYEGNGYWLAIKRLSRGKYMSWPTADSAITQILASELQKILKTIVAVKK